ncbi:unnamed protein product [Mytilus edulis]|uniref:DZIP3-like HEPN domain-containing protein n=1 Tax=Mytilus edulis TaxID=6550 RepID=A0A8S3U7J9_MYTED|nr:unnamed protein product [Mytilus edulis]
MTDDKFHRNWQKLEGSIIGIANLVQNDLPKDIRGKIENVKQLVVFSDQELKNERLCRDYWMYKCSTFEREEMKAYSELCQSISGIWEEVVHEIETLSTTVDKIRINVFGSDDVNQICAQQDIQTTVEDQNTVPVLFQLEVPSSWNTTKIIKAVEKLRLSDNSGSDLKIKAFSRDDLNLHVDVLKEVLRESVKFFTGITQLMTDILTTAKVKTDEVADVKINLRLPKSKETLNTAGGQTLRNVSRSDNLTNTSESQDTPTAYTEEHVKENRNESVDKTLINEFGSDDATQLYELQDTPTTVEDVTVPTRLKIDTEMCISFIPEGGFKKCVIAGSKIIIAKDGIGFEIFKWMALLTELSTAKREVNHLTVIDGNTVVCSYEGRFLDVIDLQTGLVKNTIKVITKGIVVEIAYEDGLLYNAIFGERISQNSNDEEHLRIIVIDLSGKQIRNFFVSSNRHGKTSIATDSNSIFSISRHNVVFCYDLKGVLKWTFEDDKPCHLTAIATYEDGQLFVVIKTIFFIVSRWKIA